MFKAMRQVKFDVAWPKLKVIIEKIMNLEETSRAEWQGSFYQIHALCMIYAGPSSSDKYESASRPYEETKKYLNSLVMSHHKAVLHSVDFLVTYNQQWKKYQEGLSILNIFLSPINNGYVMVRNTDTECKLEKEIPEIYDLGLELWQKMLRALSGKLSWYLLEELRNDRNGKCSNPAVLQDVIKSLTEVEVSNTRCKKIYEEILEGRFLSQTGEFYSTQADKEIQSGNCSQYLEKVLQWINDEVLRCKKFLLASSISKVKDQCLKTMVIDRMEYLLTEFKKLILQERTKDYKNIYALLKSMESGLDSIVSEFEEHVAKAGCDAMYTVKDMNPKAFVETFLQVREKYLNMVKECFDFDKKFIVALEKACIKILRCDEHEIFVGRSAEMLANYCDRILKKHSKGNDEATAEEALSQVAVAFMYLQDKDIFQRHYSKMLAKRLLRGGTGSFHLEETMLSKLKEKCGYEFTKKCQEMVTDIHMKSNLNEDFSGVIKTDGLDLGLDFDATVLRTSSWPYSVITTSFVVPQVLEKCITEFEKFYYKKFCGRKLSWLQHLCTAELKLCYLDKPYIISVSTHQMVTLILFEEADQVTYSKMKDTTKLDEDYLNKLIRSLTESKLITAAEKNIDGSEVVYYLNKTFSNTRTKLKIAPLTRMDRKEDKTEEMQNTQKSAEASRTISLTATIVRIMKARRKLRHNMLIEEVIEQVKNHFVPKIPLIKKCIDELIDKQYIERDPECFTEYVYIA